MGFLDELKKLTKPYADEDEEDYDDYDDEPVEEEEPAPAPRATRRSAPTQEPAYSRNAGLDTGRGTGSRIVNINTTTQLQVVLVKPERFDNVSEIADHLRDKHSVLLNLGEHGPEHCPPPGRLSVRLRLCRGWKNQKGGCLGLFAHPLQCGNRRRFGRRAGKQRRVLLIAP